MLNNTTKKKSNEFAAYPSKNSWGNNLQLPYWLDTFNDYKTWMKSKLYSWTHKIQTDNENYTNWEKLEVNVLDASVAGK